MMIPKEEDNTTNVEVPEASPDVNEAKKEAPTAAPNRRMLWFGLGSLVLVALVVGITVPLVNKNKSKENREDAAVSLATSDVSVSTSASIVTPQCFEPKEGDSCSTKESYEECLALVNSGCKNIMSTFSCPPQHRCAEPPAVACTLDVAACPDGETMIGRSGANCKFNFGKDCPTTVQLPALPTVVACQMDIRPCPDGVNSVGRSGPNCEFNYDECPQAVQLPAQPTVVACQMDVRPCPDGVNSVGRSGPNCEFNYDECPQAAVQLPEIIEEDKAVQLPEIPEESGHPCNGFSGCEPCLNSRMECAWTGGRCEPDCVLADAACYHPRYFSGMIGPEICAIAAETEETPFDEPVPVPCTMELEICPDGITSVGRTGPNCEFEACPEAPAVVACTMEILTCADGITTVGRQGPNCEFEACPGE